MNNPKFAKRLEVFHLLCTAFWIPFTVLAYSLGWLQSVTFVSLVSMIALFLGSFSSWQGARTEVKQDEADARSRPKWYKVLRFFKVVK